MTPEAALEKQIGRYRQMTGEERLKIALDLPALSCDVAREGIRQQFPAAEELFGSGAPMRTERELLIDCLERLTRLGIPYMCHWALEIGSPALLVNNCKFVARGATDDRWRRLVSSSGRPSRRLASLKAAKGIR